MSREITGHDGEFLLKDVLQLFTHTVKYLEQNFYKNIAGKIDKRIAKKSSEQIKSLSTIEPKWSETKVHSFHKSSSTKWSGSIKSIKD